MAERDRLSMKGPKRKVGRPKLAIDEEQLEKLASIDCSYEEMASILKCNPSTLTRNFAQVIEKGRAQGRASLKRRQFELAMDGNATMLIWLGKIRLGQDSPVTWTDLRAIIDENTTLMRRIVDELVPPAKRSAALEMINAFADSGRQMN